MQKTNKIFTILYLLVLALALGASVFAAFVVAPVTFNSQKWLGSEILSRFQEGLIMSQNFIGLKYFIIAAMIAIFLYEGYQYKRFNRDFIKVVSALGAIGSGALFCFFYMDAIISMQKQGEKVVNSHIFENMHKGSEIALALFLLFGFALFIRTLMQELK